MNEEAVLLFESAPVMMHAVGKDLRIVKVNRAWIDRMGYEPEEARGRLPFDFLTEESRLRHFADALPLFMHSGSIRNVGCRFRTKSGAIFDALVSAERHDPPSAGIHGYAAIYDIDDPAGWQMASGTLKSVRQGARLASECQDSQTLLSDKVLSRAVVDEELAREALGTFIELMGDVSRHLGGVHQTLSEFNEEIAVSWREIPSLLSVVATDLSKLTEAVAGMANSMERDRQAKRPELPHWLGGENDDKRDDFEGSGPAL